MIIAQALNIKYYITNERWQINKKDLNYSKL